MSRRFAAVLVILHLLVGVGRADEPPKEIVLGDCLVIKSVGRGGRFAIHTDAIEATIVAGQWKAPSA
jgi:hypothetical protein